MSRYVKIGQDIFQLEAICRVSMLENQSGISDRIIIDVGGVTVVVDSAIGGRERMDAVRERLMKVLEPEDWDASPEVAASVASAQAAAAPVSSVLFKRLAS